MVNSVAQKVNIEKVYVAMQAVCNADGTVLPRCIEWEDGFQYKIDRIIQMESVSVLNSVERCTRYKVVVRNKLTYIFYEEERSGLRRWYVERKESHHN